MVRNVNLKNTYQIILKKYLESIKVQYINYINTIVHNVY